MRIGFGYDVHKLVENRKLILGGVEIDYDKGLLGHSDADALIHAIIDALLGAAALGDIGKHFPDTSKEFEGIDSMKLLKETRGILLDNGFIVNNIDSVVAAQSPKLAPYIEKMRENISKAAGVKINRVSVKATTTERLGFEGRQEGVSAYAVCTLEQI